MLNWAWLYLLLHVVALLYVFVIPSEATVRHVRRSRASSWTEYLKSWIKEAFRGSLQFTIVQVSVKYIIAYVIVLAHLGRQAINFGHRIAALLTGQLDPGEQRRRRRVKKAYQALRGRSSRVSRSTMVARLFAAATVCALSSSGPGAPNVMAMSVVMSSELQGHRSKVHARAFDSDSGAVGIDTHASACLSHIEDDFEGPLEDTDKVVKTFGGRLIGGVKKGTLRWTVLDKYGVEHDWLIPDSYYVPLGGVRLFSPQHWARTRKGDRLTKKEAHVQINGNQVVIEWNKRLDQKIVPIDRGTNVPTFTLAPGIKAYQAFLQEADFGTDDDPLVFDSQVVSDDESTVDTETRDIDEDSLNEGWTNDSIGIGLQEDVLPAEPHEMDFSLTPSDGLTSENIVEPDEEDNPVLENVAAQLLRVHHQFNHISFAKLQAMAKGGGLPRKLSSCKAPACSACMFGKAIRRGWRDKPKNRDKQHTATVTAPGQVVSVDMMKSPTPGLVAQMAGWITGKRYNYATVYVDHYSGFGFVHLQKTQTAEETLEGKELFERKAAICGVRILRYHADNGIFAAAAWKKACTDKGQSYSYSGVNAHFQSGVAERRIRELQELSRASLIHAQNRWAEAINAHLWPYAYRTTNDTYNEVVITKTGKSPIEAFSGSLIMPEPKYVRPFGCPCYVLDSALQTAGGIKHKWTERARVGIYLGKSPLHARSVALVLNMTTGRVSPQFHVSFDPTFQTVKTSFGGKSPPSLWQTVCGFTKAKTRDRSTREEFQLEPDSTRRRRFPLSKTSPADANEPTESPNKEATHVDLTSDLAHSTADTFDRYNGQSDLLFSQDDGTVRRSNRTPKPMEGKRLDRGHGN